MCPSPYHSRAEFVALLSPLKDLVRATTSRGARVMVIKLKLGGKLAKMKLHLDF